MGLFSSILGLAEEVIKTPIVVVKDIVTAIDPDEKAETCKQIGKVAEKVDEVIDSLNPLSDKK